MSTEFKALIRIVDDSESLRDSLSFMLTCEGYDVACYDCANAFLLNDAPSVPGVLILDIKMPEVSGLELQQELNRRNFLQPIIFLTGHANIDVAVQTMRDGACDFHQKPVIPETFLPALARALEKERMRCVGAGDIKDEYENYRTLTEREEEICRLVARGLINRVIGERLGISKRTVDHLRRSALGKIHLRTAAELSGFFERIDQFKAEVIKHRCR